MPRLQSDLYQGIWEHRTALIDIVVYFMLSIDVIIADHASRPVCYPDAWRLTETIAKKHLRVDGFSDGDASGR
ncbi:hypothetical protein N7494_002959 [Penicillium frequentans]|uniref:Uncharacterized protein n=1 Tax=Penicillium frequentans TaxID=3151616 RepID=A0AAD6D5S6_9EURO|nr:hypothetical protein N7494_002959 [Penicillium glabrum]